MKRQYRKKGGWYGDSAGHALAAKGIRRYNKPKQKLVDPKFFNGVEKKVSFHEVSDMIDGQNTYMMMKGKFPDADHEELRRNAIKAVEIKDADDTLSKLDQNGVDLSVRMAEESRFFKLKAQGVLQDSVKRSLLPEEKVQVLRERMARI